jgi:hypothetical protein
MNFLFFKQDPVTEKIYAWIFIILANCFVLHGLIRSILLAHPDFLLASSIPLQTLYRQALILLPIIIYLQHVSRKALCSIFLLSLPVKGLEIWRRQTVSVFIISFSMLVSLLLVIQLIEKLLGLAMTDLIPLPAKLLQTILPELSTTILAVVYTQSRKIGREQTSHMNSGEFFLMSLGWLGLTFLLNMLPLFFTVLPTAAAWYLLKRTLVRIPTTLVEDPALDTAAVTISSETTSTKVISETSAFSCIKNIYGIWKFLLDKPKHRYLLPPSVILFGFLISGTLEYLTGESSFDYMMLLMTVYILMVAIWVMLPKLYSLDHLPIKRSSILALIILPNLFFLIIGYTAGYVVKQVASSPEYIQLRHHHRNAGYSIRIPGSIYAYSESSAIPKTGSAWGEEYPCNYVRPFAFSEILLFNPYTIPDSCSIEFAALQISRATEAAFSESISPEIIRDTYLQPDREIGYRMSRSDLSLEQDFPQLKRNPGPPLLPVFLAFVCLLTACCSTIVLRQYRAGVSAKKRKTIYVLILVILLVAHLAQFGLVLPGVFMPWSVFLLLNLKITEFIGSLPGGVISVWVLSAMLITPAWYVLLGAFHKAEFPLDRRNEKTSRN